MVDKSTEFVWWCLKQLFISSTPEVVHFKLTKETVYANLGLNPNCFGLQILYSAVLRGGVETVYVQDVRSLQISSQLSFYIQVFYGRYNSSFIHLTISLQKFQQKALKQSKQKKSKSSDFLMAELCSMKDEKVATEDFENPAFNISNTDISAHQTYKVGLIRPDKLTSSLAAHPQKFRLQAQAEPRGNECSRNYFDPLMDEEINPRQCGIEVSKEETSL
ncbi:orofacial cleft 1 candidate gene 1 protein homolog [Crotalus tigris]|uniref:orofacial cleft 1 candidate gene 1 protein homolog n=1 Tax=Crotalus tigris TaxID=88082 RepID=UPI00192F4244|nr:orofacial cleft 1 candidate gene 1 protein homolog [Crotalus tigris]